MSSDWIELYNAGPGPVDLGGWHLTDSAGDLSEWEFPAGTTLAEGAYLLVFASGQRPPTGYVDSGGFLHTNFKLTTGGEYLALVMPDGTTVASEFAPAFPVQFNDISYGTFADGGSTSDLVGASDADILIPTDGSLGLTWTVRLHSRSGPLAHRRQRRRRSDMTAAPTTDPIHRHRHGGRVPTTALGATSASRSRWPMPRRSSRCTLKIRCDDGFHAYLNGERIANRNAPADPAWNAPAPTAANEATTSRRIDVTQFLAALQNGDERPRHPGIEPSSNGSSDFLIAPELDS